MSSVSHFHPSPTTKGWDSVVHMSVLSRVTILRAGTVTNISASLRYLGQD